MGSVWHSVNIVFFGDLRDTEVERLNEQVWREVMEILFAMTVFREEFNLYFLFLVTVLLLIKSHHWLAQKRYFILASTTIGMFIKYGLLMGEIYMEGRFNNKAMCLFYLELVQDLLHLSLYLLFFFIIFMHYGLPIHLVRELYETSRNFKNRITDFLRYRRLTSNMNERFANASAEELTRDSTCIVCREDMGEAKKLPCGHLFHIHCLRQWLERQNTCPTCRAPVLPVEDEPPTEDQPNGDEMQAEEGDFAPQNVHDDGDGEHNSTSEPTAPNPTNWREMQAATTMAAANYGPSFILPILAHGYPIWYPVLFPYGPVAQLSGQQTLDSQNENVRQQDNVTRSLGSGTYAPVVVTATGNQLQHDIMIIQRWIWKHTMTQTAELILQLHQNAMQSWSAARESTSRFDVSNSSLQRREEEDQSQRYADSVILPVQNDAQLAFLKGVSEILRRHLHRCLELQHQMSAMITEVTEPLLPIPGVTMDQLLSVPVDTGERTVDPGSVQHLHRQNEATGDCQHQSSEINGMGMAVVHSDLLSLSINPLYNSSSSSSIEEKTDSTTDSETS
ncbi:hypothetical protein R1flu_008876 [Riccia fluitans]|uniref:RING-type E3 ubiquitin transferase n=1 Tax=Riccia fluitans TaxID=41844 RepID=A0ABD1Z1N7_9MARC